jgi:large subunit ribosomal protein L21
MYAIITTGGKQYRVVKGDLINVELLPADAQEGVISFKDVLLIHGDQGIKVGAPFVPEAVVQGQFVGEIKGPKEIAYKYKKRKNYRRKVGHRQRYTQVRITDIIA